MSVRLRFRRETVWVTAILSAASSGAVAVVVLGGAVALGVSAWFPVSAFGGGASTGQRAPTPEIVNWEYLDHGELGATWRLVAEDAGGPDWWPGMAVTCSGGVLGMWAFFGPGTGFHVPAVEARTDIIRMLAAARSDGLARLQRPLQLLEPRLPARQPGGAAVRPGVPVRQPGRIRGCARTRPARWGPSFASPSTNSPSVVSSIASFSRRSPGHRARAAAD